MMDWHEALGVLANPAGQPDEAIYAAERALAAAIKPHCRTDTDDLETWVADAAGTWRGDETPQSLAREYDAE